MDAKGALEEKAVDCQKQKSDYVPLITRNEATYTSCYCEENVWKLIESVERKCAGNDEITTVNGNATAINKEDLYAVFISNNAKMVPIWKQKSARTSTAPVIWDYHVICIHRRKKEEDSSCADRFVYDMDSTLDFPVAFDVYVRDALPKLAAHVASEYHRMFRVVPGRVFLQQFASDRSHMIDSRTGKYIQTPPDYPCIATSTCQNNIAEFISMSSDSDDTEAESKCDLAAVALSHESGQRGQVMSQRQFELFFSSVPA